MRGVLGIALIFVGLLLAYAVLAGKFPPGQNSSSSSSGSQNNTPIPITPGIQPPLLTSTVSSQMGLPTVQNLAGQNDQAASNGGYQYS